jgi:serine phosphatase RsbU (regulator of sigma subunit)
LYSDGVTEAMNSSSEEYGETRLADHVASPSSSIESLLEDARMFRGGSPASDDVTVVMMKAMG